MKEINKGFTLVELIITVSIFTILLGILVPSVSSVFAYRAQRAANSIASALDKTKTEAMNRLVGEMILEKKEDGYYISYCLDRGKESGVQLDQPEKIAPKNTLIRYTTTECPEGVEMKKTGDRLVITYNREDGSFRPLQKDVIGENKVNEALAANHDIMFDDMKIGEGKEETGNYCTSIIVKGGSRTRTVKLEQATGSYTIIAG